MVDAGIRRGALASQAPLAIPGKLTLEACAPATRFSFRGGAAAVAAIGTAFEVALPVEPCRAMEAGGRAALWLGPDEWLLLAPDGEASTIAARAAAALGNTPHSLVEISDRDIGLDLSGPRATDLLSAGCPLDLTIFPVGACTRTILAKTELALWRRGPELFRLELRRSLAPYTWAFLAEAAREHRA